MGVVVWPMVELEADDALASAAHLAGPRLPDETELYWNQGLLDVLFEYPIHSEGSRFSIRPKLARLGIRTLTVLRFLPSGGAVRALLPSRWSVPWPASAFAS